MDLGSVKELEADKENRSKVVVINNKNASLNHASPFKKPTAASRNELSMEMFTSLLEDSQRDDSLSHNLAMFVFLLTNTDVFLVQSCDMNNLINKMYWFTTRANKNI